MFSGRSRVQAREALQRGERQRRSKPFYKADKSRSLDTKSAGLGLHIVKSIVSLHDGEISVQNIDDKYTQFSVKLSRQTDE